MFYNKRKSRIIIKKILIFSLSLNKFIIISLKCFFGWLNIKLLSETKEKGVFNPLNSFDCILHCKIIIENWLK